MTLLNGYLQSWTLYLSGSSGDPLLLLPTWICITSVCTGFPLPPPLFFFNWLPMFYGLKALTDSFSTTDPYDHVPHYPAQDQHPQGDVHFNQCIFYRELHQHGRPSSTVTLEQDGMVQDPNYLPGGRRCSIREFDSSRAVILSAYDFHTYFFLFGYKEYIPRLLSKLERHLNRSLGVGRHGIRYYQHWQCRDR